MTTLTPPPRCARKHPGIPSRLKVYLTHLPNGRTVKYLYCHVCRKVDKASPPSRVVRAPLSFDYGVQPLNWTPPERHPEMLER